jgi:hypothetical protein
MQVCFKAQPTPNYAKWEIVLCRDGKEMWIADVDTEREAKYLCELFNAIALLVFLELSDCRN